MSDLKQCPFCGSDAVGVVRGTLVWIRCSSPVCGAGGKFTQTTESAAVAWNTRAPCPECDRQRERANEAVSRAASMADDLARHYRLLPELEAALGVAGLEGDTQMEAALARVRALKAVAEAARRDSLDLLRDGFPALYYTTAALAALDAKPQQGQEEE